MSVRGRIKLLLPKTGPQKCSRTSNGIDLIHLEASWHVSPSRKVEATATMANTPSPGAVSEMKEKGKWAVVLESVCPLS